MTRHLKALGAGGFDRDRACRRLDAAATFADHVVVVPARLTAQVQAAALSVADSLEPPARFERGK